MIVITGANGQLGQHVLESLATKVDPSNIVATARDTTKLAAAAERGIAVRHLDYNQPDSIAAAVEGAEQVLLISSSEIGQRAQQHAAVIDAAAAAGVEHLAYTSVLRADTSSLMAAVEHKATEELLANADLTTTRLRNGWYLENYTENLGPALANGAFIGSAGTGRIAAASRADFAAAAATVLADKNLWGGTYELAGPAFTMAELAAAVSSAVDQEIIYADLPANELNDALVGAGVPEPMAAFLVDADLGIADGQLDGDPTTLEKLADKPLVTLGEAVSQAIAN